MDADKGTEAAREEVQNQAAGTRIGKALTAPAESINLEKPKEAKAEPAKEAAKLEKTDVQKPVSEASAFDAAIAAAVEKAVAPLLAKLATTPDTETVNRRHAEDVTNEFIREINHYPPQMLRQFIAPSADRNELMTQIRKLDQWQKSMIDSMVKGGLLYYRNIGGSDGGGMSPVAYLENAKLKGATPAEKIGNALNSRQ